MLCCLTSLQDVKPFKTMMNCCTTCTWSVTNDNFFYNKNSSTSKTIATGPISKYYCSYTPYCISLLVKFITKFVSGPSKPPHLKSVHHSGTTFSVSFEVCPTHTCRHLHECIQCMFIISRALHIIVSRSEPY